MTSTLSDPTEDSEERDVTGRRSVLAPDDSRGARVQLNDISMRYGDVPAVDGVSIDILPGQFVTLLGASGSGKTTLLRIIAGFLQASSGQVVLDNREVSRVPVHKRRIGMVFQNYALFPHMSVARNVGFPLAMERVPRRDRAGLVAEALEKVHLSAYGARMPSELSGGQQQRVALARAIVGKPRLLLMDEPLGALDRRLRESLQLEMVRLSRELGLTVVNVTHDQEEALTMSDRIALLVGGRLVQYGAPRELYQEPATEAVARFLGESDIFTGRVSTREGLPKLDGLHGRVLIGLPRTGGPPVEGDRVSVVVRPGDVRLAEDGATIPDDHSWVPARVLSTIYAGESTKLVAAHPDGTELLVRLPAGHPDVTPGSDVLLTWPAAAGVTLLDDEGTA
jgi:putative spermidine/putrescine transport system ATP-binding protein